MLYYDYKSYCKNREDFHLLLLGFYCCTDDFLLLLAGDNDLNGLVDDTDEMNNHSCEKAPLMCDSQCLQNSHCCAASTSPTKVVSVCNKIRTYDNGGGDFQNTSMGPTSTSAHSTQAGSGAQNTQQNSGQVFECVVRKVFFFCCLLRYYLNCCGGFASSLKSWRKHQTTNTTLNLYLFI